MQTTFLDLGRGNLTLKRSRKKSEKLFRMFTL